MAEVLPSTPVEFLKGVGPKRSDALVSELGIRTCMNLLLHLPFRYEDRSQFHRIADIQGEQTAVQMQGVITQAKVARCQRKPIGLRCLTMAKPRWSFSGSVGAQWILRNLPVQKQVVIYGKPNLYKGKWNIAHPEVELLSHFETRKGDGLYPVYSSTEKLGRQGLHSQGLAKLIRNVAAAVQPAMTETLPERVLKEMKLMGRAEALRIVHAPSTPQEAERAQTRLRFEELFLCSDLCFSTKDGHPGHAWCALFGSRRRLQHVLPRPVALRVDRCPKARALARSAATSTRAGT